MEQGTPEWHAWRGLGIGSSDASVIMGCDPYRSYEDLILQKLGQGKPFKSNPAIELGSKWESAAREIFYFNEGISYEPKTFEHKEHKFLRASLDGASECKKLIEIKYVGAAKYEAALTGEIPLHHWVQMQHQHLVTDFLYGFYVCYTLNEYKTAIDRLHHVPTFYDNDFIRDKLLPAEFKFMEDLNKRRG